MTFSEMHRYRKSSFQRLYTGACELTALPKAKWRMVDLGLTTFGRRWTPIRVGPGARAYIIERESLNDFSQRGLYCFGYFDGDEKEFEEFLAEIPDN